MTELSTKEKEAIVVAKEERAGKPQGEVWVYSLIKLGWINDTALKTIKSLEEKGILNLSETNVLNSADINYSGDIENAKKYFLTGYGKSIAEKMDYFDSQRRINPGIETVGFSGKNGTMIRATSGESEFIFELVPGINIKKEKGRFQFSTQAGTVTICPMDGQNWILSCLA